MANKYEIKIYNNTGMQRRYALFAEPVPTGGNPGNTVWPSAIQSLMAPNGANAKFSIRREYAAICGTSSGTPADGAVADVMSSVPVTLGSMSADGTVVKGSSLKLIVDDGTPQFDPEVSQSDRNDGFEIRTGSFDEQLAHSQRWIIGIGIRSSTSGNNVPLGVFSPQPNVTYSIYEGKKFYVVSGNYTAGSLVDIGQVSQPLEVNFSNKPSSVSIVHQANGEMVFN